MAHTIEAFAISPRASRRALPSRAPRSRRSAPLWLAIGVLVVALVAASRPAELMSPGVDLAFTAPSPSALADPVWTDLTGAVPIFTIAGTRPAPALTRYAARIQAETGAREDVASYGAFEAGPYLRVGVSRADVARPASHFVDLARRAAETGLALVRLGRPEGLATGFEGLEVADASLASGLSGARACQSFRVRDDTLGLGLAGWFCDDAPAPAVRAQLACLIDRIALTPEGADLALQAMFAAASSRRQPGCGDDVAAAPAVERATALAGSTSKRRSPRALRRAPQRAGQT